MIHLTWLNIWLLYWLTLPACYVDYDRYLIVFLTWHILFCVLSPLLFTYFIHVISYSHIYIFFICSHVICTCIFQFILTHSLRVLTPWICKFRFVAINCWAGICRGSHAFWEAGVPLFLIIVFLFFCSCYFLILSVSHTVAIFFLYSSGIIIVLVIYMSYCSDIDLS